MATILYQSIVFGPVQSRRLGVSLGVNLLPTDGKVCSFNCIYCECGLNEERQTRSRMPQAEDVKVALENKLLAMQAEGMKPDVITFAGNGEPTLHPDFGRIVEDTLEVRNRLCPQARVAVLSNATMLHRADVFEALQRVDDNIMKLDSVMDSRIRQINAPLNPAFSFAGLMQQLAAFKGNVIIQTMFLKGNYKGQSVDNTSEEEITGWLDALRCIRPRQVMIYTLDREAPVKELEKVPREVMVSIAARVRSLGISVSVSA